MQTRIKQNKRSIHTLGFFVTRDKLRPDAKTPKSFGTRWACKKLLSLSLFLFSIDNEKSHQVFKESTDIGSKPDDDILGELKLSQHVCSVLQLGFENTIFYFLKRGAEMPWNGTRNEMNYVEVLAGLLLIAPSG